MLPDRTLPRLSRSATVLLFLLLFASITTGQDEAPASAPVESPVSGASAVDFAAPFPEDARAIFDRAVELTEGVEEAVAFLHESVEYTVHEDHRVDRTTRVVYRIMTQEAIDDGWGSVFVDWSPWHENRPEIRARVYLPGGETRDLDPATITDASQHEGDNAHYSDGRTTRAPLPAIAPGVIVEREVVVTTHAPVFEPGRVIRYSFGYRTYSTRTSRAQVNYPASKPIRHRLDGPQDNLSIAEHDDADGRRVLVVERRDLGACEPPVPYGDPSRTPLTMLTFTTAASWRDVSIGYARLVDAAIARRSDVASLADRIFGARAESSSSPEPALANPADLVDRFMEWLATNVRYTSLALGDGAIVPRDPYSVVESGFGDCKDMATLLCAVLRERGIEAHVALIRSGYDLDAPDDQPGAGLFNHAIVYIGGDRGGWIDPTYSWSRLDLLAPSCQGRLALIAAAADDDLHADPAGDSLLVRTPEPGSAHTHVIEERDVYFPVEGFARVVEVTTSTGTIGRHYRNAYALLEGEALREPFEEYARDNYSGTLEDVSFTAKSESTAKTVLSLEIDDTSYENMSGEAVVQLQEGFLFSRLPDFLSEVAPEGDRDEILVLDHAYRIELRCRVHLPPGFVVRDLPEREERAFGLASYLREYRVEDDGTVVAHVSFDSGPRVHDAAGATAFHRGFYDFANEREDLTLRFELAASRDLENGDVASAITQYRRLTQEHPDEDFYLRRLSRALLTAGLGDAARDAARRAVALAPESAKTLHNLGYVLMHDRVGRMRKPGQEREASLENLRRAHAADPDDRVACAELAIALEYDERGRQFAPGSHLEEAARVAMTFHDRFESPGLDVNLLHVLLRAGLDEQLMEFVGKTNEGLTTTVFEIVATALTKDVESAVRLARNEIPDLAARSEALRSAATLLAVRREYALTKGIVEGALPGTQYPAAMRNWIKTLEGLEPVDLESLPFDSPEGLVLRYFATAIEADPQDVRAIFSENAVATLGSETFEDFVRSVSTEFKEDTRADVAIDGIAHSPIHVSGSDDIGYRIESRSGNGLRLFAVKDEEGALRLVGISYFPVTMGDEALRRVRRGDVAGAKQWLDWARDEAPSARTDDPASPVPFTQLWTKGQDADTTDIEIAAAALMHDAKGTDVHIPILEAALREVDDDDPRAIPICKALVVALHEQPSGSEGSEHRLEVVEHFRRLAPKSVLVEAMYLAELLMLRRLDEVWELSEGTVDDPDRTRRVLGVLGFSTVHLLRANYEAAAELLHEAIEIGDANPPLLALAAQASLFTPGAPEARDVDAAKKLLASANSKEKKHEALLLQAAVLAELDPPSALQHLRDSMQPVALVHPGSGQWYVVGRLAEHYGELDAARRAYAESAATRDPEDDDDPLHLSTLAEKRLQALAEGTDAAGN